MKYFKDIEKDLNIWKNIKILEEEILINAFKKEGIEFSYDAIKKILRVNHLSIYEYWRTNIKLFKELSFV